MNRSHSMPSVWAGIMALILIFVAVACQPTAQTDGAPSSPSATPALEAGTLQPSPATQVPTSPEPTAPVVALPAPASTVPQSTVSAGGDAPLPATPTQIPHRDLIGLSPEAEKVIMLTQKDLAQRLSVAEEVILAQSIEPVTWPDASLGCPQPGMVYAQVLTPGFKVILKVGEKVYEYHTGITQPIVLCREEDSAMEDSLIPGAVEPGLEPLLDQAKGDLALKLSVAPERITVLEAKAVVWPDTGLGCPAPGMDYLQVPQDGALILLGFEGKVYEYHSGSGRAPFLCEQPLKLEKEGLPPLELPPTPGDINQ